MSLKVKIKPAFRSTVASKGIEEDYLAAVEYGNLCVGNKALFLKDMSTQYIPLEEVTSIQFDVQNQLAGSCCGLTAITTHDVSISARSGESIKIKVVNANKTYEAIRQMLKLNKDIHFSITGDIHKLCN